MRSHRRSSFRLQNGSLKWKFDSQLLSRGLLCTQTRRVSWYNLKGICIWKADAINYSRSQSWVENYPFLLQNTNWSTIIAKNQENACWWKWSTACLFIWDLWCIWAVQSYIRNYLDAFKTAKNNTSLSNGWSWVLQHVWWWDRCSYFKLCY